MVIVTALKTCTYLQHSNDLFKGISILEHDLLKARTFTMIHDVVWTAALSVSETELNTHSVTPTAVSTIPSTAPERGGEVGDV